MKKRESDSGLDIIEQDGSSGIRIGTILKPFLILFAVLLLFFVILFFVLRLAGRKHMQTPVAGAVVEIRRPEAQFEGSEQEDGQEQVQELAEGQVLYNGRVYEYNRDMLTILVMGIDREETPMDPNVERDLEGGGQSDAMFLITMNPHNKRISVIGINRNAMVPVDVYDKDGVYLGQYTKQIALQHGYGDGKELSCERTVEAVSRMFQNLPIHAYVAVHMDAIMALTEAVDGVTVTVLDDVVYPEYDMDLHQGDIVMLDGIHAYWYVRLRNENVFDSNALRLERQKQFLSLLAEKVKDKTMADLRFAIGLYRTVSAYMVTDIDMTRFTYLATEALDYQFDINKIYSVEGETLMGDQFEEFYIDNDALENLLIELFYEPAE